MRTHLTGIIVALCLLCSLPAAAAAEEDLFDTKAAAAHIEKGIHFLKSKKFDAAISELEEAVAAAPDAESYYLLGYAYYMKSKLNKDEDARQKSIENFDQAYQINPAYSPNKFKPAEPIAVPKGQTQGEITPAAAAPASTLAPPPAAEPK